MCCELFIKHVWQMFDLELLAVSLDNYTSAQNSVRGHTANHFLSLISSFSFRFQFPDLIQKLKKKKEIMSAFLSN